MDANRTSNAAIFKEGPLSLPRDREAQKEGQEMKKWRIWFEQINKTHIDVEARTEDSAILKAKREWQEESEPIVTDIQERAKK